ncbi:hypothetical protein [Streptomyces hirsutus]
MTYTVYGSTDVVPSGWSSMGCACQAALASARASGARTVIGSPSRR